MRLRKYRPEDCPQLAQLFYDTIHSVNTRDYTQEQVNAWATGQVDLEAWNQSLSAHDTVVAVSETADGLAEEICGFGDMDETGYLDRLYVHRDHQGQGIARAICDELEGRVHTPCIITHASITARPFFEKRGYGVVKEQQVERRGQLLTNFVMEKKR